MIDTKDVRGILTLVRNAVQEGPRPGPGPLDTTLPLAADTELRAGRFRQAADADGRQEKLNDFRLAMQKFPMIPALKETIAHCAAEGSADDGLRADPGQVPDSRPVDGMGPRPTRHAADGLFPGGTFVQPRWLSLRRRCRLRSHFQDLSGWPRRRAGGRIRR